MRPIAVFQFTSLIAFSGALFAASPAPAPTPDPAKAGMDAARLKPIAARMQSYVDQGKLAGVVTLIQRRGVVASIDAAGYQNVENKTPMKPDTIFEVMSMTKPVTSTAIMMLMEEGRLSLNAPVERYLPEFANQWFVDARIKDSKTGMDREMAIKRASRPITIRDLMTHTSGMREMPPAFMMNIFRRWDRTLAEAVHYYSQQPLDFEPGTRWQYSNTGMATLGRIVEVVSGMPYEKFVETRIFAPLGMTDSFFFVPENKKDRIAAVYEIRDGKMVNLGDGIYRKDSKYACPECGLFSTAADMARFLQLFLNRGEFNGKRLLSKASVAVMTSLHTGELPVWGRKDGGFGLGWLLTPGEGADNGAVAAESAFGHGGAFGTQFWADPKTGVAGVMMIQRFPNPNDDEYKSIRSMANAAIQ